MKEVGKRVELERIFRERPEKTSLMTSSGPKEELNICSKGNAANLFLIDPSQEKKVKIPREIKMVKQTVWEITEQCY